MKIFKNSYSKLIKWYSIFLLFIAAASFSNMGCKKKDKPANNQYNGPCGAQIMWKNDSILNYYNSTAFPPYNADLVFEDVKGEPTNTICSGDSVIATFEVERDSSIGDSIFFFGFAFPYIVDLDQFTKAMKCSNSISYSLNSNNPDPNQTYRCSAQLQIAVATVKNFATNEEELAYVKKHVKKLSISLQYRLMK